MSDKLPPNLSTGLIDDLSLLAADPPSLGAVIAQHLQLRSSSAADAIATLVVQDRDLMATDRACAEADHPVPVTVINTGGAGGLTALAGRKPNHLKITAIDSTLRDPGDLAGNVARVAAAARELDPDIAVHVEIPYGFGWQDAVGEVEAEGLLGKLSMPGSSDQLAEQLSGFVEADLSFVADGVPPAGLRCLLLALDALIDGSEVAEAAALLDANDQKTGWEAIRRWDEPRIARIRRRLLRVRSGEPTVLLDQLERCSSTI